jgi:hydrogenase nickel incorporation protein HypA/HybF
MHEYSIARALLRQVENLATEHRGSRVASVRVRIGEFSGIEPELLAMAYQDLVQESPLQGAALHVERVPLEAVCDTCGKRFRVERFRFECDQCGGVRLSICGGEELLLDAVTLEEMEV